MGLRSYSGNAKTTTLNGAVSAAATSLVVSDGTGYPTGASGPFVVTLESGGTAEEKVLVATRTGNTLSVSSRGWDGTAAADHANGVSVQHTISATDLSEANAHVNDASGDPHPQYLTSAEGDALFLTPTEGNAAYVAKAEVTAAQVLTSESTASTSYADLTTAGPSVAVTVGASGRVKVELSCHVANSTGTDQLNLMGVAVTGSTTRAASDDTAALASTSNGIFTGASTASILTGLTPGANTFTVKYRVGGGTGTFLRRNLIVTPI